jgi:hypothetical protein
MHPFNQQPDRSADGLRMENDFLKLKLMLEQGAQFHATPGAPPPDPVLENMFLKEVIGFEAAHRAAGIIRVGDKVGSLHDFCAADAIPEGRLGAELARLRERFHAQGIHLATLSPNIDQRELYRFMLGEFLDLPMRDLEHPGIYCFVYDDFHPDPYFENEWMALESCIRPVLNLSPVSAFLTDGGTIHLNGHEGLDEEACRERISRFRERYTDIVPLRCEALKTTIRGDDCQVTGRHETGLCEAEACRIVRGQWMVELRRGQAGQWRVSGVAIEGLDI